MGADPVVPFSGGKKCIYVFGYISGTNAFYYYTKFKEDNTKSVTHWGYANNTKKEDEYLKIAYTAPHKSKITFYSKCTVIFRDDTQTEYESGDIMNRADNDYTYFPMAIIVH